MASKVRKLVCAGNFSEARAYMTGPGTTMLRLRDIMTERSRDYTYILAQIVKIKKAGNRRLDLAYDRLFLLREMNTGCLFYLKSTTTTTTRNLMQAKGATWLGATVVVFEPTYRKVDLFKKPVITTRAPLLPFTTGVVTPLQPYRYLPECAADENVYTFGGKVADLELSRVDIVYNCGADACDGSHDTEKSCYALKDSSELRASMCAFVSSPTLDVQDVHVTSRRLARFFIDPAFLGPQYYSPKPDVDALREHVKTTLAAYKEADVNWVVTGWYKPTVSTDNVYYSRPKFHITYLAPEKVLDTVIPLQPPPAKIIKAPVVTCYKG